MDTIAAWLATVMMLIAIGLGGRPISARCPERWWLSTGVRRDGRFACTRMPIGGTSRTARGGWKDESIVPMGELDGDIYCTNGQEPIVVDDRTVSCQQRH